MASAQEIPSDRKKLWKLTREGFGFLASVIVIIASIITIMVNLGVSILSIIISIMIVLIALIVLVIILRKQTVVSPHPKLKKTLPANVLLDRRFAVRCGRPKEYMLELRKNAKVRIRIKSTRPINAYFLDKWHFDHTETWSKTPWKDTSIYDFDKTVPIPKDGKWFVVCEALDEPADVVLYVTIIEKGEEEPIWTRYLYRK